MFLTAAVVQDLTENTIAVVQMLDVKDLEEALETPVEVENLVQVPVVLDHVKIVTIHLMDVISVVAKDLVNFYKMDQRIANLRETILMIFLEDVKDLRMVAKDLQMAVKDLPMAAKDLPMAVKDLPMAAKDLQMVAKDLKILVAKDREDLEISMMRTIPAAKDQNTVIVKDHEII